MRCNTHTHPSRTPRKNTQTTPPPHPRRIKALGYDPDSAASLEATIAQHKAAIIPLKDQAAELQGQLAALNFQYKDPEQGFDRNKVKGVVAKLVRLKQPATATALEVAAAGKLYQVVVDSERTAKGLLSHGQLRQRVTIIPLNKVVCVGGVVWCGGYGGCICGERQVFIGEEYRRGV